MGRSRSRSSCRHVPPSVYCKKSKRKKKGGCRSRSRSRRSKSRGRRGGCGKRRGRSRSRGKKRRGGCGRSKSRRKGRGKRCKPGRKTNNPFLNYLRVFRKKHCGWPQCKIAIEGAKCWCKMNNNERQKYYNQACSMRKGKGRKGKKRRRRKKKRGRCP